MMIYINDIFIYSKTKIEHKIHVNKKFILLRETKFKMKVKKSKRYIKIVEIYEILSEYNIKLC